MHIILQKTTIWHKMWTTIPCIYSKSYDDNHISNVDVEGTISVEEKKKSFHKRKRKAFTDDAPV